MEKRYFLIESLFDGKQPLLRAIDVYVTMEEYSYNPSDTRNRRFFVAKGTGSLKEFSGSGLTVRDALKSYQHFIETLWLIAGGSIDCDSELRDYANNVLYHAGLLE